MQSFNTKKDETIISLHRQPDDEILELLNIQQMDKFVQFKLLLSFYIQERFKSGELKSYSRMKMWL